MKYKIQIIFLVQVRAVLCLGHTCTNTQLFVWNSSVVGGLVCLCERVRERGRRRGGGGSGEGRSRPLLFLGPVEERRGVVYVV